MPICSITEFPLVTSHLSFAFEQWKSVLYQADSAIDATCGRGKDTLKLAQIVQGSIIGLDIQEEAIRETRLVLDAHLTKDHLNRIHLFCQSHTTFPDLVKQLSIKLIVYNLGYLPRGDKRRTTMAKSTLESLKNALSLIKPGGLISITCYPGHAEGKVEQLALLHMLKHLDFSLWEVCVYRKPHSEIAPFLIFIKKIDL